MKPKSVTVILLFAHQFDDKSAASYYFDEIKKAGGNILFSSIQPAEIDLMYGCATFEIAVDGFDLLTRVLNTIQERGRHCSMHIRKDGVPVIVSSLLTLVTLAHVDIAAIDAPGVLASFTSLENRQPVCYRLQKMEASQFLGADMGTKFFGIRANLAAIGRISLAKFRNDVESTLPPDADVSVSIGWEVGGRIVGPYSYGRQFVGGRLDVLLDYPLLPDPNADDDRAVA